MGDGDLRGWWRCHGLDQAGSYVLQGAFRRTWRIVGLEIDLLSATRRHHDLLPRATALHIFSPQLPFHGLAVAWLSEQKTAPLAPLVERLAGWNDQAAVSDIGAWSSTGTTAGEAIGSGLLLGTLSKTEVADPAVLHSVCRRLAGAYLEQGGELRAPYFDLAS